MKSQDGNPASMKNEAFRWFLANTNATYQDVSERFGIPIDTIKWWGSKDSWQRKRREMEIDTEVRSNVAAQAEAMRLVLYEIIVSGTVQDAKSLSELVKSWTSLVKYSSEEEDEEESFDSEDILAAVVVQ